MNTAKTHAKDYLLELAQKSSNWLNVLITEAVATNGAIPTNRIDEIFEGFVKNITLQSNASATCAPIQSANKITLKKLTHKSGVCALAENEIIKFSDNITILYGLNGSGKSSYFRVLNEICGGNQPKQVLPNIYVEEAQQKSVDVSLEYAIGTKSKTITWDKTTRAFSDFQGVKIFDTSYLKGLLEARSPSETVVSPLGLHLFAYIADRMDMFAKKIERIICDKQETLPVIHTEDINEPLKTTLFNRRVIDDKQTIAYINQNSFTDEDEQTLSAKQKELAQIQQINYEDKIKLITAQNKVYDDFVQNLQKAQSTLASLAKELKTALEAYSTAKTKNDNARSQSQILKNLPQSDTPEWKNFITAGQNYSVKLTPEEPRRCPYCHQEIRTQETLDILNAYAAFLQDTSETELKTTYNTLESVRNKIRLFAIQLSVTADIEQVIENADALKENIALLSQYQKELLSAQTAENIVSCAIDFTQEITILKAKIANNTKDLEQYTSSKAEKEERIKTLQGEIKTLKEKKAIALQKDKFTQYITICTEIKQLRKKAGEINTRSITMLGNQAHSALLTATLQSRLESNLKKLGHKNIKVTLNIKGAKGNSKTELTLQGHNALQLVLSEGEQKAVGLAVFFSEIHDDVYPIILDDPVTSLDHEIAGNLAKMLIEFDNQVIIFCHNKLFLDGFETSKGNHICKNFDSCCDNKGKYIRIYQVYGDYREKGILSNYKGDNAESLLRQVNTLLNKKPFDDYLTATSLLRRTVERILDEDFYKYQLPPRVSNKNNRINWEELPKVNARKDLVAKLHEVHDRVSENGHDGTASIENPLSLDALKYLYNELVDIRYEYKTTNSK